MDPTSPSSGRRILLGWLRHIPLIVVILVWCATITISAGVFNNPRWGIDARVTVTAGTVFFSLVLTLLWFCLLSQFSRRTRMTVMGISLAAILLPVALLRVEQVTGYLAPTLRFRWTPRPDQQLDRLDGRAKPAARIDLTTTTPNDFPQFLGPTRSVGVDPPGLEFLFRWEEDPPRPVWRQPIGAGWSAFAAVNGYAVTMEQRDDQELTTCYEISDGQLVWANGVEARHSTTIGGIGPRSTPTIHEGRVYCLGATGIFRCLDGSDGTELWRHDLQQEFGVHEESEGVAWGRAAAPLIVDQLVIVPAGGPVDGRKYSLVAYDRISGTEVWRGGSRQVSYASPALAHLCDAPQILIVVENFLSAHDPTDGKLLWEYAWPGISTSNASCSQAIACRGDRVFVSKGYGHGCALLQIRRDSPDHWSVEEVWQNPTVMKTKFSNVVAYQDHIYGLDDVILECLDLSSGKRRWKRGRFGYGQILRVGTNLLVQSESGEIAAIQLDPERFVPLTEFPALDGKTWNTICLYGPYLLVRNAEEAACYELPHRRQNAAISAASELRDNQATLAANHAKHAP